MCSFHLVLNCFKLMTFSFFPPYSTHFCKSGVKRNKMANSSTGCLNKGGNAAGTPRMAGGQLHTPCDGNGSPLSNSSLAEARSPEGHKGWCDGPIEECRRFESQTDSSHVLSDSGATRGARSNPQVCLTFIF